MRQVDLASQRLGIEEITGNQEFHGGAQQGCRVGLRQSQDIGIFIMPVDAFAGLDQLPVS